MRSIAGSQNSILDDIIWNRFQLCGPTQPSEKVDKSCRYIEAVCWKFGRFVIPPVKKWNKLLGFEGLWILMNLREAVLAKVTVKRRKDLKNKIYI